jgi:hypothetical protein
MKYPPHPTSLFVHCFHESKMSWFLDWGLDLQITILMGFFLKMVTLYPLIVKGYGLSQFLCLYQEILFPLHFLLINSQVAPYDPNKAVSI